MNSPLKFRSSEQNIWFTGDLHYNHGKDFILNPRGYANVEEAKTKTIESWNNTVGENDIVFNLGDLCFNDGDGVYSKFLIENLKCKKHYFVWGNHNSGIKKIYKESVKSMFNMDVEVYPFYYAEKFVFLGHYVEIYIDGKPIILAHYPIESWNGISSPAWHLHGHTHQNLPQIEGFRMDVGWDRTNRPVSWNEVKEFMGLRNFKAVDHHLTKGDSCI